MFLWDIIIIIINIIIIIIINMEQLKEQVSAEIDKFVRKNTTVTQMNQL